MRLYVRASSLAAGIHDVTQNFRWTTNKEPYEPFTRFYDTDLVPSFNRDTILLPYGDVDPHSPHSSENVLRFLDFGPNTVSATTRDIPLSSVLGDLKGINFGQVDDWQRPSFVVRSWNGKDIILLSYVSNVKRPNGDAWLVRI